MILTNINGRILLLEVLFAMGSTAGASNARTSMPQDVNAPSWGWGLVPATRPTSY
jgi:hypothetical protein